MRFFQKDKCSNLLKSVKKAVKKSLTVLVGLFFRKKSYCVFGVPFGLTGHLDPILELYPQERLSYSPPEKLAVKKNAILFSAGALISLSDGLATKEGGNLNAKGKLISTFLMPLDGKPLNQHALFNFSSKNFFPKIFESAEPVATVAFGWQGAFYHWMYEVLPRLHLAQIGAPYFQKKWFVEARLAFQKESLELLDIAPSQIINCSDFDAVKTPLLFVPSIPNGPTRWGCQFLRASFLPKLQKTTKKRLYISRKDARSRRILNEKDVKELLTSFGFEPICLTEFSLKQQMEHFYSAEAVVGPHGAGFSHLVFCDPETRVLEIFAPHYLNLCYWEVCQCASLSYQAFFGKKKEDDVSSDPDIEVDLKELESVLKCWF